MRKGKKLGCDSIHVAVATPQRLAPGMSAAYPTMLTWSRMVLRMSSGRPASA